MDLSRTALLLIGFQNDYFHPKGILHNVFENKVQLDAVLSNTCKVIEAFANSEALIIETPINFTPDYSELDEPIGILKIIKDNGAFVKDDFGSQAIAAIHDSEASIACLPGKRGLNCFSNTALEEMLREQAIEEVIIVGAVTSLCIDTAGREAMDLGFKVTILSDCILGRTDVEQQFYLEHIMPLYSKVLTSQELIESLSSIHEC